MTVAGPGSLWDGAGDFLVGHSGAGNLLTITNGGQVVSGSGAIGWAPSASNNSALVTRSGSLWSNKSAWTGADLSLGGYAHRLTILDGGRVDNDGASIGSIGSGSNAVRVSGHGSV